MFDDKHFVNLLGDQLSKKPTAKKLEQFMAQQLKQIINSMLLDAKITESFNAMNERI